MSKQTLVAISAKAYNHIVTQANTVGVRPTGYLNKKVLHRFNVKYAALPVKAKTPLLPATSRRKVMNVMLPDEIYSHIVSAAVRQGRTMTEAMQKIIAQVCELPIADVRVPRTNSGRGPSKLSMSEMRCTCCGQAHRFNREKWRWDQYDTEAKE